MRKAIFYLAATMALAPAGAFADLCGPTKGIAGRFDYYLFSLSWAPAFCATSAGKSNPAECGPGARYGFVVHGLWPQYATGQWPQCCQAVAPLRPSATVDKVAQVMIGAGLREHEWQKHGSCVTSRQDSYFAGIDQAVQAVGLAPTLPPSGGTRLKVADVKRHWPVPAEAISVQCKGRRLTEVHICLDKALAPMACPESEAKADNCPGTVSLD